MICLMLIYSGLHVCMFARNAPFFYCVAKKVNFSLILYIRYVSLSL